MRTVLGFSLAALAGGLLLFAWNPWRKPDLVEPSGHGLALAEREDRAPPTLIAPSAPDDERLVIPAAPAATARPSTAIDAPAAELAAPAAEPIEDFELVVLADDRPLVGVEVACYRDPDARTGLPVGNGAMRARTDTEGVARVRARLEDLRHVAIEQAGADPCLLSPQIHGTGKQRRFVLPIGTARLEGRVFDDDGRPARGAHVSAFQIARADESRLEFRSVSDELGTYRLPGLAGGRDHALVVSLTGLVGGTGTEVQLAPGERRTLDLGAPLGSARVRGTVRLATGAPLAGPERLYFERADGAVQDVFFGEDGRFDLEIACGVYTVSLGRFSGVSLGQIDIRADVTLESVLPGSALSGRVEYVGKKHPLPSGPEREVELRLEREDGEGFRHTLVRRAGSYTYCGLAPGRYVLTTRPWVPLGAQDGRVPVVIEKEGSVVTLDLSITDP